MRALNRKRLITVVLTTVGASLLSCKKDGCGLVCPSASLSVSPTSLTFSGTQGAVNPLPQTVTISNTGSGGNLGTLAVNGIDYGAGATAWLQAQLSNSTLTVTPVLAGVAPGTFIATISVSASGAGNSPQRVSVSLTVTGLPSIGLAPTTLAFNASQGGTNPAPQTVTVTSSGAGSLNGLAVGAITYSANATGWLQATLSGSSAPATLTAQVVLAGVPTGTHTAILPVTSSGASNSPQNVTVTLTVAPPIISMIAFQRGTSSNRDVWRMNPDGTSAIQLTSNTAGDYVPAISPDGSKIAFVRDGSLYVMNADGTGATFLPTGASNASHPAWSRDGSKIAYTEFTGANVFLFKGDIRIVSSTGQPLLTLANTANDEQHASWSPDGSSIIYVRDPDAATLFDIYKVASAGGTPQQLRVTPTVGERDVVYSPDGTKIAYTDATNVFVVDASGIGTPVQLTSTSSNSGPTWSPDGSRIAYASGTGGFNDIWVMNADGTNKINLTNTPTETEDRPSWGLKTGVEPRACINFTAPAPISAVQGGPNPAPQILTISNGCQAALTGLSTGTITYGPGASAWLTASLSGPAANPTATLSLQATTGALAPGTYTATVPLSSNVATPGSVSLVVTLTVTGQPSIALSATAVSMSAAQGGANPASQAVTITNGGSGTLSGISIGTVVYTGGSPGWLASSLSGTTASPSVTLTLQATTGALVAGTYTATVPVTSSVASNSPRNVVVTFTITATPSITLSTSTITMSATVGGASPANQFVTITNGGGGTLSGLTLGTVVYAGGPTAWLAPSLNGTTASPSVTLTLQAATGTLPLGGPYTATLPVQSSVASNSPRNVVVTLNVTSAPPVLGPIVFERWTGAYGEPNGDIWRMDALGANQVQLTVNSTFDGVPDLSPDKSTIVFTSFRLGSYDIHLMNGDGSNVRLLKGTPGLTETNPIFSPNGLQVLYTPIFSSTDTDIFLINTDGTGLTQLLNSLDIETNPTWSGSGLDFAFEAVIAGNRDIYRRPVAGGTSPPLTRLTTDPGDDSYPAWSPDGTKIAFVSNRTGSSQIFVMDANGTNVVQLTSVGANIEPAWSPDGTKILYSSFQSGFFDIWVMSSTGLNQTDLTNTPAVNEAAPRWR